MAKIKFEKLDLQTKDLTAINIEKIGALFPNVITEYETEQGEITKGIDFELLQQLLSKELVDGNKEKYQLNWPGRKAALLKANTPITETLRPDIANSKNWDNTENVFIEGDNFTALKILQESYPGKIKMIYIDPPYNTGKDFVYSDKFTIEKSEYAEKIGQYDEENNKLFKEHSKTNPRYHSDWLSMMYERLYIARDLLREDGVIFISIDDNEVHNLRKICDEIFGEENFVSQMIWRSKGGSGTDVLTIQTETEYCLVYCRNINKVSLNKEVYDLEGYNLKDNFYEERGYYKLNKLDRQSMGYVKSLDFTIQKDELIAIPGGTENENNKKTWRWRWSQKKVLEGIQNEAIVLKKDKKGVVNAYYKIYEKWDNEGNSIERSRPYRNLIPEGISTSSGTIEMKKLFENRVFDFPKPIKFISYLLKISSNSSDIILDFFAGSGTTAHAVMQLNAEDGGNRKFIMVQLDEETDEKSEAYSAGYKTIAELSLERIRRAGEKILVENKDKLATRETELDIGFRAFRVDSTNMKDVYYHPKDLKQDNLLDLVDTIKADRQTEDLLIQILLDKGLTLDLPIKTQKFKNNTVYIVGDNDLVVCMDTVLDADIIDDLAQLGADTAVFRDSSFATEADRIKLETHFKRLSPRDTRILVI